jgi:hypothetical protein
MKKLSLLAGLVLTLGLAAGAYALVGKKGDNSGTGLNGFGEVPANSTTGTGQLTLEIKADDQKINYKLTYRKLEGTAAQAHIHLGQKDVNGGVVAFLCGGGGKPNCPATEGTVSGTIVPADVTAGAAAQGIAAGEFTEFVRAIRAGMTYANVHTSKFGGGEIRGQIRPGKRKGEDKKGKDRA